MSFASARRWARYWRAVVYDTYTGRQWLSTAQDEVEFTAGDSVSLPAWEMRRPLTQTVTLMGPTGSVLFAAPDIVCASVPMKATVRSFAAPEAGQPVAEEGAQAAGPFEISMARAEQTFEEGDAYTIVSANTTVTELALREASVDYPPAILEQYLQLPENFSARVAADAVAITAGEDTVYGKARALETASAHAGIQ